MRIRTQLIVAAFLLAVLPLAAIVTWSYHSSRRALEAAYRQEAERQTRQMDRRLASIRSELDSRVQVVGALPMPGTGGGGGEDASNLAAVMGGSSYVDAFDYQPLRDGTSIVPPDVKARVEQLAERESDPETQARAATPGTPAVPQVAEAAPVPAAPPAPPAPMVIEIPSMPALPRFVVSEEHQELVNEISRIGVQLADLGLDPEVRADLQQEMRAAQKELRDVLAGERRRYDAQIREVIVEQRRNSRPSEEPPEPSRPRNRETVAEQASAAPRAAVPATAAVPAPRPVIHVNVRGATAKDLEKAAVNAKKAALILGRDYKVPISKEGELVGQLSARISAREVIHRVLGGQADDSAEIPFAIDREGTVYTRNSDEKARLTRLGIPQRVAAGRSTRDLTGWIVSLSTDPVSGLKYGVARPVSDNLGELRRTAAQNFMLGLGLIAFALVGIVPFSNHLSRDVKLVTDGAERISQGDLMTRLPVKTENEIGQLSRAFNRMAEDLSHQQQKLVEQERAAKEKELQQRLLAVEYDRKTSELEEARRFQLSMLPKVVPQHPFWDVAVFTRTATEVGGDYYDFHLSGDTLSITIGDATGHGAKAGTMVTVVKTLFAGYDGMISPACFLGEAEATIRRMELGRMAMALTLARFEGRRLSLASAGMPPALVHRASSFAVEEIALEATPLGTFGSDYPERSLELLAGDSVLLMTDGFPELLNHSGQQLGYPGALDAFAEAAAGAADAAAVIARLEEVARRWHGETPPNDDVTFVVIRAM